MPTGTPDITYPSDFVLPVINPNPPKRLPYFKEHPTPGPGRAKGSHNKVPYDLKRELVEAAAEVGFSGEGDQGLRGYLKHLAIRYPKCFANLLGKVLPMQASVDVSTTPTITSVNILSVPTGVHLDAAQMALAEQGEPFTINHEPTPDETAPEPIGPIENPQLSEEEEVQLISKLQQEIGELARQAGIPLVQHQR